MIRYTNWSGIVSPKSGFSGDGNLWNAAVNRLGGLQINFSYGESNNETRPKSKFYNLLIYAGYPA